jgi:hypothetical protein
VCDDDQWPGGYHHHANSGGEGREGLAFFPFPAFHGAGGVMRTCCEVCAENFVILSTGSDHSVPI